MLHTVSCMAVLLEHRETDPSFLQQWWCSTVAWRYRHLWFANRTPLGRTFPCLNARLVRRWLSHNSSVSCTTLIKFDWRKLITPTADILSDTMLVAAPGAATFAILHLTEDANTGHAVTLLWNVGTTTVQRVGLIAIFGSTVATTAVSLVHAVYIIMFGGLPEIFTAVIEVR